MSRQIRNQIFNLREGTAGKPGGDPIQDLVDEYKAYVTTQGGEHGVSDAALYSQYELMVTEGWIDNTGTNLKDAKIFGVWGFKRDGGSLVTNIYTLTKSGGNYENIVLTLTPKYQDGHFNMKPIEVVYASIPFHVPYTTESFEIELDADVAYGALSMIILLVAESPDVILRYRVRSNNLLEFRTGLPASTVNGANFYYNGRKKYKTVCTRAAGKLNAENFRDGVSHSVYAERDWTSDLAVTIMELRQEVDGTFNLTSFRINKL